VKDYKTICVVTKGITGTYGYKVIETKNKTVIFLIELPENTGMSITNNIERVAATVYHGALDFGTSFTLIKNITFIEHYLDSDVFEEVIFQPRAFENPRWKLANIDIKTMELLYG